MLRTLAINSNQIVLSFGVLMTFLSPRQSEIKENSLESMERCPDTPLENGGTWDVTSFQNKVARLARFS